MTDDLLARTSFAADGPMHRLLRRLAERATAAVPLPAAPDPADRPFLSVLTRTQGRRPETLRELLLCLAAQTCDDFELLVLCHDVPADRAAALDEVLAEVLAELDSPLRGKVRRVDVAGGGRSRPLNVGIEQARGRYLVAVDDDDLVLAHWAAEFRRLADEAPGAVLRAVVAEQDVVETPDVAPGHTAASAIRTPYAERFDILGHLVSNQTPNLGAAFPRECFDLLGLRYDEMLPVFEDWDLLVEAALLCGVASTPEVTAVYRRWQHQGSSLLEAGEESWRATERDLAARMDARELLLPPGTFSALRWYKAEQLEYAAEHERMAGARDAAEVELSRVTDLLAQTQQQMADVIRSYEESTSWRLTAPVRRATDTARRLRGGAS